MHTDAERRWRTPATGVGPKARGLRAMSHVFVWAAPFRNLLVWTRERETRERLALIVNIHLEKNKNHPKWTVRQQTLKPYKVWCKINVVFWVNITKKNLAYFSDCAKAVMIVAIRVLSEDVTLSKKTQLILIVQIFKVYLVIVCISCE